MVMDITVVIIITIVMVTILRTATALQREHLPKTDRR
jgi:hypothetical protein